MRNEIGDIEKIQHDLIFYMLVDNEEKAAVYVSMVHNFRGTGY